MTIDATPDNTRHLIGLHITSQQVDAIEWYGWYPVVDADDIIIDIARADDGRYEIDDAMGAMRPRP